MFRRLLNDPYSVSSNFSTVKPTCLCVVRCVEVLLERLERVEDSPRVVGVSVVVDLNEKQVHRRLQFGRLLPQLDQPRPMREGTAEVVDARRVHEHVLRLEQRKHEVLQLVAVHHQRDAISA